MAKTILVVDDEKRLRDLVQAYLTQEGFRVVTAADGQEALFVARHEKPDLIVLDLMMEKHDAGFSFSKQIKNDPLFKRIPILMVTAVADATGYKFSLERDGYWMKTDGFLDKPVEPSVLIGKVEKLLEQKEE